jgi:predicted 3-demethylubiquinone-9 3-methyltransferase (glyoxalase superfamily)
VPAQLNLFDEERIASRAVRCAFIRKVDLVGFCQLVGGYERLCISHESSRNDAGTMPEYNRVTEGTVQNIMQKIMPHLWFDKQAREAAELYVSLSPGAKISSVTRLTDTPSGDCDLVSFELGGQPFMAISAGPLFKFNPSVSFHIRCETTQEVDAMWARLSPGGRILMPLDKYPFSERYGWLEDKYGLSWQVIHAGEGPVLQKIMPCLMFVGNVCGKAEEAINYYVSVFKDAPNGSGGDTNAEVLARYGKGDEPDKEGSVRYVRFSLLGQEFGAMDSAREHKFAFNEAISFIVPCDTQQQIDYFWERLPADPNAGQCGWLKDKYGLSWQITPAVMRDLLGGNDKARIERVTQAFLKMKKFDIAEIKRAAAG